jgi:hypothetical protein
MSENRTNRRDFIRIAAAGAAALGLGLRGINDNAARGGNMISPLMPAGQESVMGLAYPKSGKLLL